MAAENNVKTEPAKPAQETRENSNTENSNARSGGGPQGGSGGPAGNNRGGGGGAGARGRKNSRFSGGRGGGGGGNHGGGGGPRNNQDTQIKMSESMTEAMETNSHENNKMGGGGPHGGRGGGMRGGRGGGRGGPGGPGGNRGGGGMGGMDGGMNRSQDDRLMERLMSLSGPTHDLPPQETSEKKFNGRNRLYVGSLPNDITEEEIKSMFTPFGETSELFLNKEKNFAFVRMDFRVNAEKAKHELDGHMWKGRPLKVRFAPHLSKLKIKNLTPWISNELLEKAFGVFGDIERATVIVDERGQSTCEGIVEYSRKSSAMLALKKCTEACYFLTASLRPVVVEQLQQQDDIDGYPDKNIPRKNTDDFFEARKVGPRFAQFGSFEHEYGTRWKQLHELYKQKEAALKREMIAEEEKLDAQMEYARYEHETEVLRERLRQREADREHKKRQWEMKERKFEEQRTHEEENRRREEEDMSLRIRRQEEQLHRRQQENNLFMQEQALRAGVGSAGVGGSGSVGGGSGNGNSGGKNYEPLLNNSSREGFGGPDGGNNLPVDPKSFMDSYNMDRNNRGSGGYNDERVGGQLMDLMDMRVDMGSMGVNNRANNTGVGGGGGGRWQGGNDRNRQEDYPTKRRRY